jgi:Lrp/AsnC family transcriptional regulator, leucine-responsive regulatory protein
MHDASDSAILEILQRNCKTPLADIAEHVGLSVPAVSERIRKLEARGIIRRYAAILDDRRLGRDITAFIHVLLEHPRYDDVFVETVSGIPEVLECHHVVGQYSYLLKVKTANTRGLEELLAKKIKAVSGVAQTMTVVALSTSKEETALPVAVHADLAGAGRP